MSNNYLLEVEDNLANFSPTVAPDDIFSSFINNNNVTTNLTEEPENSLLARLLNSPDKYVKEQPELQQYEFYFELLAKIHDIMNSSDESRKQKVVSQSFMEREDEPTPTENDYGMMYLLQKNRSPKRRAADWPWTDDQRVNTVKKMRVRYWKLRKGRGFEFQMRRYVFGWEPDDKNPEQLEPVIMIAHLVKDIRQNQAKKVIKKESK